jgi:hypothetical protein
MSWYVITTYAHYLSIVLLELLGVLLERGDLARSTAGKVHRVERKHNILPASELTEGDISMSNGWKHKFWGHISYFRWHLHFSFYK